MNSKRLPSIELIRIIACFLVLALHLIEDFFSGYGVKFLDTLILVPLYGAVTVFWMITGFFIFNRKYEDLLKKTLKKIWIPVLIISSICLVLYDVYLNITTGQKMLSPFSYIANIITNTICFRTFAPSCTHFWYAYTYCLVIVFYPVLNSFVNYLDESKKRQKVFIAISLLFIIINELSFNNFACIDNHGLSAVVMASIEIICGHILYENIDSFLCRKKIVFICMLSLLCINVIKALLYMYLAMNDLSLKVISSWYSLSSIISAVMVTIICIKLNTNSESKLNRIFLIFGPLTFYVYLIHKIPIKVLGKLGIFQLISNSSFIVKYLYFIVCALCCFAISILLSYLIDKIVNLLYRKKTVDNK